MAFCRAAGQRTDGEAVFKRHLLRLKRWLLLQTMTVSTICNSVLGDPTPLLALTGATDVYTHRTLIHMKHM